MGDRTFVRPHPDCEAIDEIRMRLVPRFKTSHLTGDEWRVSALIEFFHKGKKVYEHAVLSMEDAARFLPWLMTVTLRDSAEVPLDAFASTLEKCAQAGCAERTVNEYRLKKIYSSRGEGPLPNVSGFEYRRAFCQKHSHRGDAALEDCDDNYELVRGPGHKTLNPGDISPSQFGGTFSAE